MSHTNERHRWASNSVIAPPRYENQYHFLLRFDADGKVIKFKEYLDTLYMFETLYRGQSEL